jgi:hypothetical protein
VGADAALERTGRSSMGYSGDFAAGRPGVMFHPERQQDSEAYW